MKRKPHSTSLVLLLVCIFTFWWGISVLAQRDLESAPVASQGTLSFASAPIVVNESVKNGTYTYSGVYMPKSVCDSFGSGIHYTAEDGGHVAVLLITDPSSIACAQAAGAAVGEPFSVSIKLGAGNRPQFDGVMLNGAAIQSQLVSGV